MLQLTAVIHFLQDGIIGIIGSADIVRGKPNVIEVIVIRHGVRWFQHMASATRWIEEWDQPSVFLPSREESRKSAIPVGKRGKQLLLIPEQVEFLTNLWRKDAVVQDVRAFQRLILPLKLLRQHIEAHLADGVVCDMRCPFLLCAEPVCNLDLDLPLCQACRDGYRKVRFVVCSAVKGYTVNAEQRTIVAF